MFPSSFESKWNEKNVNQYSSFDVLIKSHRKSRHTQYVYVKYNKMYKRFYICTAFKMLKMPYNIVFWRLIDNVIASMKSVW